MGPINYSLQGIQTPFQSLAGGFQMGAQIAEMDAMRQQRQMQTAAMQQQMLAQQQAAEREQELMRLQSVPFNEMTRPQQLRLLQLTQGGAAQAYIADQLQRVPQERTLGTMRRYGGLVNALVMNPEIGVRLLKENAEAETDPAEKKSMNELVRIAEGDPIMAARMLHGSMDMIGLQDKETKGISDAVINNLSRLGKPLYPEAPSKPMIVPAGSTVVQDGRPVFTAPSSPGAPTEVERLSDRLKDPSLSPQQRRAIEGRLSVLTTREPRAESTGSPVAVVDPATGRPVLVSREEALSGRMTPAAAMEGLTPKERQNREAKFPQATSALKTFESSSDTLVKELERLRDHPGLDSITGIAAGRLPGLTPNGRAAEALFDKLVARGQFQELQNLRNSSPTGGALGNVSNAEGDRLRQAFAALDRRQEARDVRAAIDIAIGEIRQSKGRLRDAYDLTYEYRQGDGSTATTPPPAPATFPKPPQAAIEALKAGRGTDAQFDAVFGPGAAARAKGR